MIAEQADGTVVHHKVETFARIGTVADHVSQAKDLIHLLIADVREDTLEGFQVAVDIANNGALQVAVRLGKLDPARKLPVMFARQYPSNHIPTESRPFGSLPIE